MKWNTKAPADIRRLLRRGTNSSSGLSGIGSAGSRQNALHSVVSLVTCVFDQSVIRVPQRDLHRPWFEPRVRVVERHRPRKIIRSCALEALDHVKLFAIVHEGFGAVVGGVHDQSVAFQRPRESPFHVFTLAGGCGLPSRGMILASWMFSCSTTAAVADW